MRRMTEVQTIARIQKQARVYGGAVLRGIGDDCAALKNLARGEVLLCTTDLLIEGVHFRMDFTNPVLLGEKALAVNLSDIAAMGGAPVAYFVALAVPRTHVHRFIDPFYQGLRLTARAHCVTLAGGDLSHSPQGIFISITVLGKALRTRVLYRSGARPGDRIFVTGTLGASATGLRLLQGGRTLRTRDADVFRAIFSHLHIEPRVAVGAWLAAHRWATAMMDLSDGLATDLNHLCTESKVGAVVHTAPLPIDPVTKKLERDPIRTALTGGEDYELLFTVPARKAGALKRAYPAGFPSITEIGEITAARRVRLVDVGGRSRPLPAAGYDHFRPSVARHTQT